MVIEISLSRGKNLFLQWFGIEVLGNNDDVSVKIHYEYPETVLSLMAE